MNKSIIKKSFLFAMVLLSTLLSIAQDVTKTEVRTTTTETTQWYMQPWAWVTGGVVLIMLFIGLSRRKK